ncbi:Glutamate [NMDA] receptor-associated protein 1 [Fukomys damarensis]|uniref:Glutamate [NMDA] receptor-associated protein 1 n=1 Tax=Fukomys damarensis TaxID=885580 RepID=A0A091D141_FUKDA|nr:Glutamate [NMDA] receptor-associated protein 1 [Fukomys damarensis]
MGSALFSRAQFRFREASGTLAASGLCDVSPFLCLGVAPIEQTRLYQAPAVLLEMDLQVIVPVDLGSGDHQHLARKAVDEGASQSGRPSTSSPAEKPKEAKGNPSPKADKRANIYVIQISDDPTPNDSSETTTPSPLSDRSVRQAFVAKVFLLLSAQLLITAIIIGTFVFWKALRVWVVTHPWFICALFPAFFVIFIALACCGNIRREVPANYILLGLFVSKPSQHLF